MSTELNCPARNISLILECLADAGSSLEKETNLKIQRFKNLCCHRERKLSVAVIIPVLSS